MAQPQITLIAAVDREFGLGKDGDLLFKIPADMQHFKAATLGKPVLMGRKTYESIPPAYRPLEGRHNIVLTRDTSWQETGVTVVHDVEEAIGAAGAAPELMVAGGGEIYALLMPLATRLLVTHVDGDGHAEVFFPLINDAVWRVTQRAKLPTKNLAAEVWEYERR